MKCDHPTLADELAGSIQPESGMYALIYHMVDVKKSTEMRPAHIEFLKGLLREGKVIDGCKFPDYKNGHVQGMLVCKANSKDEVASWFEKDPVISSGSRTFEVREYEAMSIQV